MDVRKLKEGELRRYKSGLLGSKWKESWVALFNDSTLAIYDKKGDSRPVEQFFLKDIAPYICVGLMTDRMPTRRPSLPTGASIHHLVAFGQDPRAEKVTWLLFGSDADLEAWFNAITQTLPKPQNPPPSAPIAGQPPIQPVPSQTGGYVPPAQYPARPNSYSPNPAPPNYNQPSPNSQPYYQGPAQPQSTHTTVIVDRDRPSYGSGYSSGSSGLGLGSGLLMGSLLGYGIGSFFTPHYYSSGFGGFGLGHGFGGGYPMMGGGGYSGYQDNDTYNNITNNYYNTDSHDTTNDTTYTNDADNDQNTYENDYQQDYQEDANDYDQDFGGDDFGGGDFDGGDW